MHSLSSTGKAFSIAENLAVNRLCELVRGDVAHTFIHAQKHVKNEKKLVSLLGVVSFLPQPEIVSPFTGSRECSIRQHL